MSKQVAEEIYRQIGGGRASVMIGMYGQGYGTDEEGNPYLSFSFKAGRVANACRITLNSKDLYDMVVEKISNRMTGIHRKLVASYEGVYGDQLKKLFEGATGLYLSL